MRRRSYYSHGPAPADMVALTRQALRWRLDIYTVAAFSPLLKACVMERLSSVARNNHRSPCRRPHCLQKVGELEPVPRAPEGLSLPLLQGGKSIVSSGKASSQEKMLSKDAKNRESSTDFGVDKYGKHTDTQLCAFFFFS